MIESILHSEMSSEAKAATADELLAKKMSETIFRKKPFYDIREGLYLIRQKTELNRKDSASKAIGTTGIRYCVGMYCEINDTDCFIWHAYGHPMNWTAHNEPEPKSSDQIRISNRYAQWLKNKMGPATDLVRASLVLATGEFDLENWAIIDGILTWADVEDKEEWKQQKLRCASAFIIEEPGNGEGVRYFPPLEAMAASHPGHWSRCWEADYLGLALEDKLGKISPVARECGAERE